MQAYIPPIPGWARKTENRNLRLPAKKWIVQTCPFVTKLCRLVVHTSLATWPSLSPNGWVSVKIWDIYEFPVGTRFLHGENCQGDQSWKSNIFSPKPIRLGSELVKLQYWCVLQVYQVWWQTGKFGLFISRLEVSNFDFQLFVLSLESVEYRLP